MLVPFLKDSSRSERASKSKSAVASYVSESSSDCVSWSSVLGSVGESPISLLVREPLASVVMLKVNSLTYLRSYPR